VVGSEDSGGPGLVRPRLVAGDLPDALFLEVVLKVIHQVVAIGVFMITLVVFFFFFFVFFLFLFLWFTKRCRSRLSSVVKG